MYGFTKVIDLKHVGGGQAYSKCFNNYYEYYWAYSTCKVLGWEVYMGLFI